MSKISTQMESIAMRDVLRTEYQKSVADYWNAEKDPVNIKLGEVDGLYHHHYGLGEWDPSVLAGPQDTRDQRIIEELHRLETAQADVLGWPALLPAEEAKPASLERWWQWVLTPDAPRLAAAIAHRYAGESRA